MTRSLRIVALAIALFAIFVGGASARERCDGANLQFAAEFAELTSRLGDAMGEPLDCREHAANGDIIQHTTTGTAFLRPSVGIPTFTDGWRHWELTNDGIRMWSKTTAYDVTIKSLTSAQPFTPAVIATHRSNVQLFATGQPASPEIQDVAENGAVPGLVQWWHDNPDASHVAVAFGGGEHPPIMPGASSTITIVADRGADQLSVASMLICTNDGFTGGAGLALPEAFGQTANYMARAYDAGTERNTEDFADLVPPCQPLGGVSSDDAGTGMSNPDLAEDGVIARHGGVHGDLPTSDLKVEAHGWDIDAPVMQITVTQVGLVPTYEVAIENLTGTQPLTPAVVATHGSSLKLFGRGEAVSPELQDLAENGGVPGLHAALSDDADVVDVAVAAAGGPPPIMPGASVTATVTGGPGATYLSAAAMLICTNDGFSGVASLALPTMIGEAVTPSAVAYDAGTERNTEDFADLVPPCQGLRGVSSNDAGTGMSDPELAEGGVVAHHRGIDGALPTSDLTIEAHGWDTDAPVVKITVTRIR
ncbi:MAG: spondin domain-containing protein [Chloroflexi bacterium]|nr:spondin domain-containing protein [Chloroflexota bacterium]